MSKKHRSRFHLVQPQNPERHSISIVPRLINVCKVYNISYERLVAFLSDIEIKDISPTPILEDSTLKFTFHSKNKKKQYRKNSILDSETLKLIDIEFQSDKMEIDKIRGITDVTFISPGNNALIEQAFSEDNEQIKEISHSEKLTEEINSDILNVDSSAAISKLEKKYVDASPQIKEIISKRIERGSISVAIKKLYDYKCLLCGALNLYPYSFKKNNGEYYIETHHIIPVSNLAKGSLGTSNLITLCANHHRQFHYGNIEIIDNTEKNLTLRIDSETINLNKKKFH